MATHAPPEVRRAQILDAALRCFARKGYHAAKVDDIASDSGLSKGAIYWHFDSKEEIFLALLDAYEQAIFAAWDALPTSPALEALHAEGRIALERILETRVLLDAWSEFIAHPGARERFARIYERSRARVAQVVRDGIERGELCRCDPLHVAAGLTALVEGLLLQAFADPDYDPLAAWPELCRLLARGLAA